MKWHKYGIIIKPQNHLWWMQSYAMVPTVDHLQESLYRVYFSGRDKENRSCIGYVTVNIDEIHKAYGYKPELVLKPGDLGCFDDNGVTPSWIVNHQGKKYMYYIGWNKRSRVRMSLITGLAISNDGGVSFERFSRAPILERTDLEPYAILTGACVLIDNNIWKMWYVSGVGWITEDLPRYNIKYAESKDGIYWDRKGLMSIDFKSKEETALARPCVLKEDGIYKMWYSYKGKDYRIGYAESSDGIAWERKDSQAGIDVSSSGWDSEMIEYAFVFNHKGKKNMFYNGNDYGKEGIGYAVEE